MSYQRLTRAQWQAAVNTLGRDKAEAWRARSGVEVEGLPPTTPMVTPMVTPTSASATTPAQVAPLAVRPPVDEDLYNMYTVGGTGEGADMPEDAGVDFSTLDPMYQGTLRSINRVAAEQESLRKSQFEQGKAMLDKLYAGPSRTQQLFALSQAFLAPRRRGMGGFAQTLSNVGEALGGFSQQSQDAKRARAEALMRLQQSYDTSTLEGKGSALDRQLKLIEMAARQRAAAAKANAPKFMAVPQGGALVDVNAVSELPVLTPEQVRALSADPRNKGKQFRTADGRIMEIG